MTGNGHDRCHQPKRESEDDSSEGVLTGQQQADKEGEEHAEVDERSAVCGGEPEHDRVALNITAGATQHNVLELVEESWDDVVVRYLTTVLPREVVNAQWTDEEGHQPSK